MARPAKKPVRSARTKKQHPWKLILALFLLLAIASTAVGMRIAANVVHVRHTDVYLQDLPAGFDGTTVLFISDPDILSDSSLGSVRKLMRRLQALKPDLLILGGDYTADPLLDTLNRGGDAFEDPDKTRRAADFFESLSEFIAPMGKYAVLSGEDPDRDELAEAARAGSVRILQDEVCPVTRGGDRIYLAATGTSSDLSDIAGRVSGRDCVIACAHSCSALTGIQIAEADGGGQWADLALFGGSHGGQIRIGKRTLVAMNDRELQYPGGWYTENGLKLLVSEGLGCESVRMRLGTCSEVHFLTLRCGEAEN